MKERIMELTDQKIEEIVDNRIFMYADPARPYTHNDLRDAFHRGMLKYREVMRGIE